jgi:hypothetical protein
LEQGAHIPLHVDSHPEDRKSFEDFSPDEWGNYIADRAAGTHLQDLDQHQLDYYITEITAQQLLNDLPPAGMWYWGNSQGQPLPLQPLLSHKHDALHRQYITDRDNYRAKLPTPLPRYWYDNSLRYSANVYEMQKCSSSSLASRIRIVMNKGWHGGNRIKSKKAAQEDARLTGTLASQLHRLFSTRS